MVWSIFATVFCVFMAFACILFAKIMSSYQDFFFAKSLMWALVSVVPWIVFIIQVALKFVDFLSNLLLVFDFGLEIFKAFFFWEDAFFLFELKY